MDRQKGRELDGKRGRKMEIDDSERENGRGRRGESKKRRKAKKMLSTKGSKHGRKKSMEGER